MLQNWPGKIAKNTKNRVWWLLDQLYSRSRLINCMESIRNMFKRFISYYSQSLVHIHILVRTLRFFEKSPNFTKIMFLRRAYIIASWLSEVHWNHIENADKLENNTVFIQLLAETVNACKSISFWCEYTYINSCCRIRIQPQNDRCSKVLCTLCK